jgi:hypothetical protein
MVGTDINSAPAGPVRSGPAGNEKNLFLVRTHQLYSEVAERNSGCTAVGRVSEDFKDTGDSQ